MAAADEPQVVFYQHNKEPQEDVEAIFDEPTELVDEKVQNDTESFEVDDNGSDEPVQRSYFSSTKKAIIGLVTLCIVAATGIATGASISASKNSSNAQMTQIQTQMSKAAKAASPDIFECVFLPLGGLFEPVGEDLCDFEGGEPPTRKEYDNFFWKDYSKTCSSFWGDVFFLIYRTVLELGAYLKDKFCWTWPTPTPPPPNAPPDVMSFESLGFGEPEQVSSLGFGTQMFFGGGGLGGGLPFFIYEECDLRYLLLGEYPWDETRRRMMGMGFPPGFGMGPPPGFTPVADAVDDIDGFLERARDCGRAVLNDDPCAGRRCRVLSFIRDEANRRLFAKTERGLATADKEKYFERLVSQEKKFVTEEEKMEIYSKLEDSAFTRLAWLLVTDGAKKDLKRWLDQDPGVAWLRSKDGRGLMWWAHESGNHEIADMLKEKGVPHTDKDIDGDTPHDLRNRRLRELLIEHKDEYIEKVTNQEKKVITDEEKKEIYSTWEDTPFTTLAWLLITTNDVEDLQRWLEKDQGAAWLRSEDGRGLMWWAYEASNQDVIDMLTEMGVPNTDKDKRGIAPVDFMTDTK